MDVVLVRVGLLSLGVVASLACGSVAEGPAAITPSSPSTASSLLNVRGSIDRGTPRPCPTGEVCDAPLTAVFVDFSQPGKPDVRTPVDGSGAFAVHLEPGLYSISAAPPPMNGKLKPSELVVPKTGSVALSLVITYLSP
jgi:hypothetical protein